MSYIHTTLSEILEYEYTMKQAKRIRKALLEGEPQEEVIAALLLEIEDLHKSCSNLESTIESLELVISSDAAGRALDREEAAKRVEDLKMILAEQALEIIRLNKIIAGK